MSTTPTFRDHQWLEARVQHIWNTYYAEAPAGYPIVARFGPRARYRFGSIYSRGKTCHILVNGLFAHPDVPEYVVDATIAHELAHYIHGYGSGLRKLHAHPHRGGVVDREMKRRGCYGLEERAGAWRRANWQNFYLQQSAVSEARRAERAAGEEACWDHYLSTPGYRTEAQLETRLRSLADCFDISDFHYRPEWMKASIRRRGLSYQFDRNQTIRLHALLASPDVPDEVVDYELSYWLAMHVAGMRWSEIEETIRQAGLWALAEKAIEWRRNIWPQYLAAHHPLKQK